jgi:hypothetical protein
MDVAQRATLGFGQSTLDCDGALNGFDIAPFVLAMISVTEYQAAYPGCNLDNVDMNCDGAIDGFDIDPFVLVISGNLMGYYDLYLDCEHLPAGCNTDGAVDGFDIDPFVMLVGGG